MEIEHAGDVCVLRVTGRLETGSDLEELCARSDEVKSRNCSRLMADIREVPFIGSTGIGFVVGLYTSVTKNAGGRFVLVGSCPRVREVLNLTRLSTVIPMADDVDSGMAMLRG